MAEFIAPAIGIVGSLFGGGSESDAASDASSSQLQASQMQLAETKRQFDEIQKLLAPYVGAGTSAVGGQQALLGLSGADAQRAAIQGISNGPQMQAMLQQGENSILQNASATGGLRGGNTQSALAQFRPQLLNQLINQQFSNLGGLTSVGQNAAAGVGNAGQIASGQMNNIYGQQGAINAGNALAQGKAQSNMINNLTNAAGFAFGSPSSGSSGGLFGTGSTFLTDLFGA